ncbi:general transcription factor 3C polypeptide 2 isoform X2 [Clupea harengus]|uniref:General transcription factor 3C polypeptide 2 n=1 Tax=Clupea harengus TaxID=7950 RepID=A0A6P8GPB0_CLUHA|nr:general transcription factor 3C polypeptide 2 isoform X2 [Clupea harengus]
MASGTHKLGRCRNRVMGLPKGEDLVQPAGRRRGQSANKSSLSANGDSSKAPVKCESQAFDSNLQEAELAAEVGSDMTNSTQGTGQDNCIQSDSTLLTSEGSTNATPTKTKRKAHAWSTGKRRRKQPAETSPKTPKAAPATPKAAVKRRRSAPQATSTPMGKIAAPLEAPSSPGTPELTLGGRPKRRAAKAAIEYLHSLVNSLNDTHADSQKTDDETDSAPSTKTKTKTPKKAATGRGKKRKAPEPDSDPAEDSDFVPEGKEEDDDEEEDSEEVEDDDLDKDFSLQREPRKRGAGFLKEFTKRSRPPQVVYGTASNGLPNRLMSPVWTAFPVHKEFRNDNLLPWVFPEWIPSLKDWQFLATSEAEAYLPQETESPAFMLSREQLTKGNTLQRLKRFESMPYHGERWDATFFVGGPVWAMEWCPCPDGSTGSQYVAMYCNRDMDSRHKVKSLHTGPGLLQIWDLGDLNYRTRPSREAQLSYCLAQDEGCVWSLKWCPSGAWELPCTARKSPQMPRLGLLAAGCSSGRIVIYSLPHPDALLTHRRSQTDGEASQGPLICRVQPVLTLCLGSSSISGQCLTLDWMPVKPHNLLAAGFYDGMVALWDLSTKSSLLRVRAPGKSPSIHPFHSFLAHDDVVRSVSWCRASGDHMVTAGDDRMTKMWDLQRTHTPLCAFKRFLTTEAIWPLRWSGVLMSQECSFATHGQQGIHFVDSGFVGFKHLFVLPRKATLWSLSLSEWLNSCVTADSIGEMVMVLIPTLGMTGINLKKTSDRRFPVYRGEMVRFSPEAETERGEEDGDGGGGGVKDPEAEPNTYREAVKKYHIHFHDSDMRNFKGAASRPSTKLMRSSEMKGAIKIDRMPLTSIHKVRINPNLVASTWVLSAGQSGLVRIHCLRCLQGSIMEKLQRESEVQFSAMFPSQEDPDAATTVQSTTEGTVLVS